MATSTQATITVAATAITPVPGVPVHTVQASAPLTLSAAPTIPNGVDGQVVTLVNTAASAITVQDQGTLANSNLRLGATTRALGTRDTLTLLYVAALGDWVEIAFDNNL